MEKHQKQKIKRRREKERGHTCQSSLAVRTARRLSHFKVQHIELFSVIAIEDGNLAGSGF